VEAFVVVVILLAVAAIATTCFSLGYERGREEGRRVVQKAEWEGAAYSKLIDDLAVSVRSLEAIARQPDVYPAADRKYWREQARFSITALEGGLLPRLTRGEVVSAYGEPIDPVPIRRMLLRARAALEKVPA
jgi:hypothetical protein